jgi:two-component system sensor histidine kinase/response regulator
MGPTSPAARETGRQSPRIVTEHSLKEAKDLRRPRVLLAEDNQTNQMAAVRMLELLGYQVDVAVNGIEAVAACREIDYGIVLMDKQMPEMDGLTATREIRAFELARGKSPVPIIALTADAMQGDREQCIETGMNDYLSKPFKVTQLSEVLERWGHRSPLVVPLPDAAPVSGGSAIDSTVFDVFREPGAGRGANDFVAQLITQYLAEATNRLASLKDALERRDTAAFQRATHSLKGTSVTVGANGIVAICKTLEQLVRNTTLDGTPALVAELEDEFIRVRHALEIEQESEV